MNLFYPNRQVSTVLTAAAILCATLVASGQSAGDADAVTPIKMDNVPVTTAIVSLVRLTGTNFILDPKIATQYWNADGSVTPEPTVTFAWTNMTPSQALTRLLKEHGLFMVGDPATTIALIGYTNRITNPVDPAQLGGSTDALIVPIVLEEMPLDDALKSLARLAHIKVMLDPKLSATPGLPDSKPAPVPAVTVRWHDVTLQQAIAALCENYHLAVVKDDAIGGIRIKPRD
jgi:hypothetical protein